MAMIKKLFVMAITCTLGIGLPSLAFAQGDYRAPYDSPYSHKMDFFSPTDLDLDFLPTENHEGWFFGYDKLSWTTLGERVRVGANITRKAFAVWAPTGSNGLNALGAGTVFPENYPAGHPLGSVVNNPNGYQQIGDNGIRVVDPATGLLRDIFAPDLPNSIESGMPRSKFAWGDRYELGYSDGSKGFIISVIEGPEQSQAMSLGFDGGAQEGQGGLQLDGQNGLQSPLGDVVVHFDYQFGYMHGFLDIRDPTTPGSVLGSDSDGDGILDGDGFADDIDEDSQFGPDGFDIDTPGGIPDSIISGATPDWDDLVELPTSFRTVVLRNRMQIHGIELMGSHILSNRHWQVKHQNQHIELRYGVRYLRLRDTFLFDGDGGVLGETSFNTTLTNNLVGPQIGFRWTEQRGKLGLNAQGRFLFGYNVRNWEQFGGVGEDLTPGRHNHPLYATPHSFSYGRSDDDFSPLGEMRLQTTYQLTKDVALQLGWTGIFVDNIRRASTHVRYRLPEVGFRDGPKDTMIVNGINFGVVINH